MILTTPNHLLYFMGFFECVRAIWGQKKTYFGAMGGKKNRDFWKPMKLWDVEVLYFKCMFDIGIQPPCKIHSVKSFVPESQRTDIVRVYKRTWGNYLYKSKCVYIYKYIVI